MMEDLEQQVEKRKEAELEEALELWQEMRSVDREKGWYRLVAALPQKQGKTAKALWMRTTPMVAAVCVLLLTAGVAVWLWQKPAQKAESVVVAAHSGQPRLILDNGEEILLDEGVAQGSMETREFVIDRKGKNIVYTGNDSLPSGQLRYNTLEIPRGAEYELVLADGTRVWLNAETRLRYPVKFSADERRVYLEGEAYFAVAKNADRPFRVESVAQTVEVLGTQFNIYAYANESYVYTTLVEGRVAVSFSGSGKRVELKPGQQAVLDSGDGRVKVEHVDVEKAIAWRNGIFVFDDQNLETILWKVARWYDVEILYKNNAAKSLEFKGNLPRYGELPDLLKVLESGSGVHFSLQGRSIVVE